MGYSSMPFLLYLSLHFPTFLLPNALLSYRTTLDTLILRNNSNMNFKLDYETGEISETGGELIENPQRLLKLVKLMESPKTFEG